MFSKSCKYGVRAVLHLAVHSTESNKIGVKELSEAIDVPSPFIAKILQDLSRKKLVSSTKGPNGGFFLKAENREQNVLAIIESIDGLSSFSECNFGLEKCGDDHPCPIHHLVSPFRNSLYNKLKDNSIDDFAQKLKDGETHLKSF